MRSSSRSPTTLSAERGQENPSVPMCGGRPGKLPKGKAVEDGDVQMRRELAHMI